MSGKKYYNFKLIKPIDTFNDVITEVNSLINHVTTSSNESLVHSHTDIYLYNLDHGKCPEKDPDLNKIVYLISVIFKYPPNHE